MELFTTTELYKRLDIYMKPKVKSPQDIVMIEKINRELDKREIFNKVA